MHEEHGHSGVVEGVATDDARDRILRYLETHPKASDTFEAVVQWWLGPDCFSVPREVVRSALERLVRQGQLLTKTHADGTVVYARAVDRDGI